MPGLCMTRGVASAPLTVDARPGVPIFNLLVSHFQPGGETTHSLDSAAASPQPKMPGTFTDEQRNKYRKIFEELDTNHDGVLEASELAAAGKTLGYRIPKDQMLTLLVKLDKDVEKGLAFDEFLDAMPGSDIISEEEHKKAEYRQKFQEFDVNGDGFISPAEAQQVLERDLGFTAEKTNDLVKQFDINNDGQLSYEEFVAFYVRVKNQKEAIQNAFKQFDKENKGYASMDDAKRILGGFLFEPDEVERLILAHDTNHDGKIQYDEFIQFWNA